MAAEDIYCSLGVGGGAAVQRGQEGGQRNLGGTYGWSEGKEGGRGKKLKELLLRVGPQGAPVCLGGSLKETFLRGETEWRPVSLQSGKGSKWGRRLTPEFHSPLLQRKNGERPCTNRSLWLRLNSSREGGVLGEG